MKIIYNYTFSYTAIAILKDKFFNPPALEDESQ
jgi:hypothetical protein